MIKLYLILLFFGVEVSDFNKNGYYWYLEGKFKDNTPWIIPVNSRRFKIGRLETNDLILSSAAVSREHAILLIDENGLQIDDLCSKNGLYVNGKKIDCRTRLNESDILKIGSSEFSVNIKDDVDEQESEQTLAWDKENTHVSFSDYYQLSERETEIIFFLIKGCSLQQIGDSLFISAGTVKNHVLKIYKKTNCHSRIELSTKYNEFHH